MKAGSRAAATLASDTTSASLHLGAKAIDAFKRADPSWSEASEKYTSYNDDG